LLRGSNVLSPANFGLFKHLLITTAGLLGTPPHTHITTDADTATLFGDNAGQGSGLGETRELLGREDGEGLGLDLHTEESDFLVAHGLTVFFLLALFEEGKVKAILAFVADRKVWKDEVTGRGRPVKVRHS